MECVSICRDAVGGLAQRQVLNSCDNVSRSGAACRPPSNWLPRGLAGSSSLCSAYVNRSEGLKLACGGGVAWKGKPDGERGRVVSAKGSDNGSPRPEYSSDAKIRSEVIAPFRALRMFFYGAFMASGGIGGLIAITRLIASLNNAPGAEAPIEIAKGLAIDFGAVFIFALLYRSESKARDKALAKIGREENLSNLRLELANKKVVTIGQLRKTSRISILAGPRCYFEETLRQSEPCKMDLLEHMALSFSFTTCPVPTPFANALTIFASRNFGNQLAGTTLWPAHSPDFQGRLRNGSQLGPVLDNWSRRMSSMTVAAERSSMNGPQKSTRPTGTRKVVEHLVLFKMEDMTDEQEKDMLDHLYSLQYYYRGILTVSLGNVVERMPEGVTHAFFQRFPSFETLEQYMDHPAPLKVEGEFIDPYCKGIIVADFEAEVKDDLEALFRRGDQFQQGIEHVVLIKVREGASQAGTEAMLEAFNALPQQMDPSVIVQLTAGANVSDLNKGYTHAVFVRVPSEEALDTFSKHPAYMRVFTEKVLPISAGLLSADFLVDPVTKSSPL